MFEILIGIIVLVVFTMFFFTSTRIGKGLLGELVVSACLGRKKGTLKINNLSFEGDQRSVQIDHVLLTPKGLFVIETKNYAGRIYGDENSKEWKQVLNYGKVKNSIYNPIKQNHTHIFQLKKRLNGVFTGRASIQYLGETSIPVIYPIKLKKTIKELGKNNENLSVEDFNKISELLLSIKKNEHVKNKKHVEDIKNMLDGIDNGICPRCGGKLIQKQGKYGSFFGCSSYPKCKFIK